MKTDAEKLKIAVEALELYENVTRLMLEVKDIAKYYGHSNSPVDSLSIADNGDTARVALKLIRDDK